MVAIAGRLRLDKLDHDLPRSGGRSQSWPASLHRPQARHCCHRNSKPKAFGRWLESRHDAVCV